MLTVLFACVHNAGRSQMAAAFFNQLADPEHARAVSAGTRPAARVHPEVVQVMREVGIDLESLRPQPLTDSLARSAQIQVTMGCGDACPVTPGALQLAWELDDPKDRDIETVRAIRDTIRDHVVALLRSEHVATRRPAVACTLTSEQLQTRRTQLLPGLVERAMRVDAGDGVVRLHFAPSTGLLAAIAAVIDAERQCCAFLTFDLRVPESAGWITLTVSAPAEAAPLLSDLIRA